MNTKIDFILAGEASVTMSIGVLLCLSYKSQARPTQKYSLLGLLLLVFVTVS